MSVLAFEHPWLSGLFGDDEIAQFLSAEYQLAAMLEVEKAYTGALEQAGEIPSPLAARCQSALDNVDINIAELQNGTARDGVVVPSLLNQIRAQIDKDLHPVLHIGMTSQDVIDTALVLGLREICSVIAKRLTNLIAKLQNIEDQVQNTSIMGRTRMQAAKEIAGADRVANWRSPLIRHADRLNAIQDNTLLVQLGGPVGNRREMGPSANNVAREMARQLELGSADTAWHSQRDTLVEFANLLSLISGSIGKMAGDIVLMAQQGVDEVKLAGSGGSSAMEHKQNPVKAEILISLARYNAVQMAGMHQALLHEQERSGAAWSLEWLILPQICLATGASLSNASVLIDDLVRIGDHEIHASGSPT